MPRDVGIKRAFEIADDGMQGVIGYFLYVQACQDLATESEVIKNLPPESIQITHEWNRYYHPQELCHIMGDVFPLYHARTALISLIGIFEGALKNFIERLLETENISKSDKPGRSYKARLKWAFNVAKSSTIKKNSMRDRIPDLCLHLDHARRIRNLWMHNNGLLDEEYGKGIPVDGREPHIVAEYSEFLKNKQPIPFILKPEAFKLFSLSHIELLHHLHSAIQAHYFGDKNSYSYKAEGKAIEWHRCLVGI